MGLFIQYGITDHDSYIFFLHIPQFSFLIYSLLNDPPSARMKKQCYPSCKPCNVLHAGTTIRSHRNLKLGVKNVSKVIRSKATLHLA